MYTQLSTYGSSMAFMPTVRPGGTFMKPPDPNSAAQMKVGVAGLPWYTMMSSPRHETSSDFVFSTVPAGQSVGAVNFS